MAELDAQPDTAMAIKATPAKSGKPLRKTETPD